MINNTKIGIERISINKNIKTDSHSISNAGILPKHNLRAVPSAKRCYQTAASAENVRRSAAMSSAHDFNPAANVHQAGKRQSSYPAAIQRIFGLSLFFHRNDQTRSSRYSSSLSSRSSLEGPLLLSSQATSVKASVAAANPQAIFTICCFISLLLF